jgi:hypothetical protein
VVLSAGSQVTYLVALEAGLEEVFMFQDRLAFPYMRRAAAAAGGQAMAALVALAGQQMEVRVVQESYLPLIQL